MHELANVGVKCHRSRAIARRMRHGNVTLPCRGPVHVLVQVLECKGQFAVQIEACPSSYHLDPGMEETQKGRDLACE